MRILIGADIVPTPSNSKYFENGQMERIIDESLLEVLEDVDYRIFNLEVPLTDKETPIRKCGPNLIAPVKTVVGISQIKVNFLTLANNHIMDQGNDGLFSTIKILEENNIAYGGIGNSIKVASKPYVSSVGNTRIGIYCCAEHEFSIAGEDYPGANPFDPLTSLDDIVELRNQCDYLICLYHGGKEHYRYPSPNLQKVCRRIVDKGADLVICQHSHCIGCEEKWKDSTIIYGQGNFIFDYSNNEYWQTSILVVIDPQNYSIDYVPIIKNGNAVKLAKGKDADTIIGDFKDRSDLILQPNFVQNEYKRFASNMIGMYMSRDISYFNSKFFKVINKLSHYSLRKCIIKRRIKKYSLMYINQYDCEAHRELIINGLEDSFDYE